MPAVPSKPKLVAPVFLVVCGVACNAGCASDNWSVESEPIESSMTLLEGNSEVERVLVAETSHAGRIHATVNLPGAPVARGDDGEGDPVPLVMAELILDDAHSHVTLPGTGGQLSVRCPGERCAGDEARLSVRLLSGAEIDDSGLFVQWAAYAETFGRGAKVPEDAQATLRAER